MAWTWPTEVELLRDLVAIPSVSGTEAAIGQFVESWASSRGLSVARGDDGVLVTVAGARPGPTLAFVSHLDTVPAGEGWTRPPFEPVIEGTQLYGRGSGDAKASVAAMLVAATELQHRRDQWRGRLVLLLGYGEETKQTSMPVLAARAGAIDAAVVGEPTNLEAAVAQRGLMMAELVARGDQRHAGLRRRRRVHQLDHRPRPRPGAPRRACSTSGSTRCSGPTTVTATMLEAGREPQRDAAGGARHPRHPEHAGLDPRRGGRGAQVPARLRGGGDLRAAGSLRDARGLAPARRRPEGAPELKTFGSPTCSDWVFVRETDAIKLGPGTSRRSHTADEYVDLAEVTRGAGVLRGAGGGVPQMKRADRRTDGPTDRGPATLWSQGATTRRAHAGLHRGRRSGVGHPAAPLGRARQPRPHRGAPRQRAALGARSRRAARRTSRRAQGGRCRATRHRAPARGRALRRRGLAHPAHRCRGGAGAHRPLPQRPGRLRHPALPQADHARRSRGGARFRRGAARLCRAAPDRALARLHPSAPGDALVGRTLGRRARGSPARRSGEESRRSGPGWTARPSAAPPATACPSPSGARPRCARSDSAGSTWRSPPPSSPAGSSRRRSSPGAPTWRTRRAARPAT